MSVFFSRVMKLFCASTAALTFANTGHANLIFKEDPHYDYVQLIQCYEDLSPQGNAVYGKHLLSIVFRNKQRDSLHIRNDIHYSGGVLIKGETPRFVITERPGDRGRNMLHIEFLESLNFELNFSADHYHLKTKLTKNPKNSEPENIMNMICAISSFWESRRINK